MSRACQLANQALFLSNGKIPHLPICVYRAEIGISNEYDYVVCGHIHQPEMKEIKNDKGSIMYLNSGDWIENLTALEFNEGKWSIYKYNDDEVAKSIDLKKSKDHKQKSNQLFEELVNEFNLMKRA